MKSHLKQAWLACALIAFAGCVPEGGVPLIGVDGSGNGAQTRIAGAKYSASVAELIASARESAMPALERAKPRKGWRLRTLVFGIGVDPEIGIGPVKIGAVPRARVIFSNSNDVTAP